jgi:hypothetical protein
MTIRCVTTQKSADLIHEVTVTEHNITRNYIQKPFQKIKRKSKGTRLLGRAIPRQKDKMKPHLKKHGAREGTGFIWLGIEINARLLIKG